MHAVEVAHIEHLAAEKAIRRLKYVATPVSMYGSTALIPPNEPTVNSPNSYGLGHLMLLARSMSSNFLNVIRHGHRIINLIDLLYSYFINNEYTDTHIHLLDQCQRTYGLLLIMP